MAGVNPATQGTRNWSDEFYEAFRFWDKINNPPRPPPAVQQKRRAAIRASYNASQAVPFTLPALPIVVPAPAVPARLPPVIRPDNIPLLAPDIEPEEARYLRARHWPRRHGGVRANWSAVKILGSGAGGSVALWEWIGPAAGAPKQTKVAVKGARRPRNRLTDEGRIMQELGTARSEHIVKLLVPRHVLTPAMCTRRGLSNRWNGRTWQLVLEYCPGGTLDDLLDIRKARNIRFEERTLWLVFECLVDGCSVLEYGMELGYDENDETAFVPNTYDPTTSLTTVVHRDLKPTNIFIGTRSRSHGDIPVFKVMAAPRRSFITPLRTFGLTFHGIQLGDLGLSEHWQKVFANNPNPWRHIDYERYHRRVRRRGTPKYYTPESFHPGWNHNDYQVSSICGKFGSHTNVWQIGAIIIACFNLGPPEAHLPFTPGHLIHGANPLGRLYGTQLRNQPGLSANLKDTIHECLYELPGNRANLLTLKTRIRSALDSMALNPRSRPEGLQDIECPELVTEAQAALPAFAIVKKQCTALKKQPGNPQCRNWVDVRTNNIRPRCFHHWDLREFQQL
ncbi:kinase-like protein [Cadophora sp. DSE1049]|nr:kinase-like protein [Cadophora sp. DSE1049]